MFGRLLTRQSVPETRAIGQATTWGDWQGESMTAQTWSGARVDNRSATQLLTVYGCVRFIADAIAALPVDVKHKETDGSRSERPVPDWLVKPIPGLDWTAFCTQILVSLLLDGNAFFQVDYQRAAPFTLTPLDPSTVEVRRVNGKRAFFIHGAQQTADIRHIPGIMMAGAERGLSPVEAARQSIGLGMAAQEHGARFFGQGASLAGVVEVPKPMPPERSKEMGKAINRAWGGKNKAGLVGVLDDGATWKTIGVTNEQAQFLETRNFSSSEIAGQMFLIDPSDLGIGHLTGSSSSLTYANLEQRNTRRLQVTFMPWIVRLEKAITDLLAPNDVMKLNTDAMLRGDTATRGAFYATMVGINAMQINEVRALEDLPPLPEDPAVVPGGVADQSITPVADPTAMPLNGSKPVAPAQPVPAARSDVYLHLTSPDIHVAAPDIDLAPQFTIQPPDVRVDVAAPHVDVMAPNVNVEAAPVPPPKKLIRTVERDKDGRILRVVDN